MTLHYSHMFQTVILSMMLRNQLSTTKPLDMRSAMLFMRQRSQQNNTCVIQSCIIDNILLQMFRPIITLTALPLSCFVLSG